MPASSEQTISIDTQADPATAYALLADLSGFRTWLPRSGVYRGTTSGQTRGPAAAGDAYADRTPLSTLEGRVLHADPPRRIAFEQHTAPGSPQIRITYTLHPGPAGGTRIERTGIITTAGPLRAFHGPVVAFTRRETDAR